MTTTGSRRALAAVRASAHRVVWVVAWAMVLAVAVSVERPLPSAYAAPALTVAPSQGIAGETVTFSGRFAGARRPITLQRRSGQSWVAVVTSRTTSTGRFTIARQIRSATTTYRVYAKRVRISGRLYQAAASTSRTITTQRQSATLSLPTTATTDQQITATARFGPIRSGRPVVLEVGSGTSWVKVTSGTESSTGVVTFRFRVSSTGVKVYRARALTYRGAVPVSSASRTVTVTAPPPPPPGPDTTPPPVPSGVAAVAGDARASVTWQPASAPDLAGYKVYQAVSPDGAWTAAGQTLRDVSSFTITGLSNTVTYRVAVTAIDTSGNESTRSVPATVTPVAAPDPGFGVVEHCGTISTSQTWTPAQVHVLTCDVTVASTVTVSVSAGTIVKIHDNARILVEGEFHADGTAALPVVFATIHDDSVGGDTSQDGAPTPQQLAWQGAILGGTGSITINHAEFKRGGLRVEADAVISHAVALYIETSQGDVTVNDSRTTGDLYVTLPDSPRASASVIGNTVGGDLNVTNRFGPSTIRDNTVAGTLKAASGTQSQEPGDQLVVEGNQVAGSSLEVGMFALWIDAGSVWGTPSPVVRDNTVMTSHQTIYVRGANLDPGNFSNNTVAGGQPGVFELVGRVTGDLTVSADDELPLVIGSTVCGEAASWLWLSGLQVAPGATMTVGAGATIKFNFHSPGCWGSVAPSLTVDGTLETHGTSAAPVVFTAHTDDTAGGDIYGDGQNPDQAHAQWPGIGANPGSRVALNGVDVRYAYAALSASVESHAEIHGRVADSQIGVYGENGAYVDARDVDWGDENGPAPLGTGVPFAGAGVLVIPWTGQAPQQPTPTEPDPGTSPTTSTDQCKPLMFLGARGSSEAPLDRFDDAAYTTWQDGFGLPVQAVYSGFAGALGNDADSKHKAIALRYAAMHVPLVEIVDGGLPGAFPVSMAAAFYIPAYAASVAQGAYRIKQYLENENRLCPDQRYVLVGYSQGALAIHIYLTLFATADVKSKIAAVGLVADPAKNINPDEAVYTNGFVEATEGSNALSRHGVYPLWGAGPLPVTVADRTVSLCHQNDIVCAFGWGASFDGHDYTTNWNEMREMGARLAERAQQP